MSSRSCKKQDVNLDHLYYKAESNAYIKSSSTSSDLITIIKENKQLKSMLLLHLDLIQEQSDQLLTKEKQISNLRQENESLKLKIERMERRMHMKQTRSILHHLPTVETKVKNNGMTPKPHFRMDLALPGNAAKCDNGMEDVKPDVGVMLQRTQVDVQEKAVEPNGVPIGKIVLNNAGNIENIQPAEKALKEIKLEIVDERPPDSPEVSNPPVEHAEEMPQEQMEEKQQVVDVVPSMDVGGQFEVEVEDEGAKKRRLSEQLAAPSEKAAKKAPKLATMTTSKQYVTRDWELLELEEELMQIIEKRGDIEINLEVPSWRIVDDDEPPEMIFETFEEEIREEAYMKRHLKFEIDERRRKKWDVQRIREQRTIERLKKRHYKLDAATAGEDKGAACPASFYPSPDTIRFIQITDELPVQAFGEQIPTVPPAEFRLPWEGTSGDGGSHAVLIAPQEPEKCVASTMFVKRMSGQKMHHKTPRKNAQKAAAGSKR
uniref:PEHE domain-containing protein n=1 Tax=Lutzomyia longipalpis TaxID=7200 RepID=A0A1B0CQ62_LUTLO